MSEPTNDTDECTRQTMCKLLGTLTPQERLMRMCKLSKFGAEVMLNDIKNKYPDAIQSEIDWHFAIRVWGKDLADKYLSKGIQPVEEFDRANNVELPDSNAAVLVSSVEYNIIAKLRWCRMSNRQLSLQLRDVKGLIDINRSTLDLDYLRIRAAELGFSDLLEENLLVLQK